jgi:carbon storage regulator
MGSNGMEESRMLVLTRRVNETVMIGDDITVTILGINNNQVRLGMKAPRRVPVHREEVYEKIRLQGVPDTGTD